MLQKSYLIETKSDNNKTYDLAINELKNYLAKGAIPLEGKISLGLFSDFNDLEIINRENDSYIVDIAMDCGGKIAGTNYRSVLFGVYAYLEALGFRWLRPGVQGEIIPELPLLSRVFLDETASYQHRGICIEGAVSEQNVLETIDWLTKQRGSEYFIQFRDGFTFFDRWYSHKYNPELEREEFDLDNILNRVIVYARERDLNLHMVGHGWTCEPLGIPGRGWFREVPEAAKDPKISECFALINGKRELWGEIALNTNLCYSNQRVRKLMVEDVIKWSKAHPDVNVVHFWLGDGVNNQCECEHCVKFRPSDWYVVLLNELDARLTQENIDIKIVCLAYVDLLWPPVENSINNIDRFILMFAPITRSYTKSFQAEGEIPEELPPYNRNKLVFPYEVANNIAFLREWQKIGFKDSFDFDYHYMWCHYHDTGYYEIAQILHEDCRNLQDINLNGLMSCQGQRVFYPHGLGMLVMFKTLWNRDVDFEKTATDYFSDAYGDNGDDARQYFISVTKLIPLSIFRNSKLASPEHIEMTHNLYKYEELVKKVTPALNAGLQSTILLHKNSWEMLQLHIEQTRLLIDFLCVGENRAKAIEIFKSILNLLRKNEMKWQPYIDLYEYTFSMLELFGFSEEELEL